MPWCNDQLARQFCSVRSSADDELTKVVAKHVACAHDEDFADTLNLSIHVSHFPPGTSKWNKVEHRLFSFISMNWRGRPLRSYETVINLISNTTNHGGLVVRARLDRRSYPIGKKISKREFSQLNIVPADFHGDWNYVVKPRPQPR